MRAIQGKKPNSIDVKKYRQIGAFQSQILFLGVQISKQNKISLKCFKSYSSFKKIQNQIIKIIWCSQSFYTKIIVFIKSKMQWVNNLCNCFNPQIRRSIIGYLSASNLNRQVIQQEKCTQQIQQHQQQSIYQKVKQKSYYTIHAQDLQNLQKQQFDEENKLQFENELDPHWYPQNKQTSYDQIFQHKLKALKNILDIQIDEQYQKVYDSQDQNKLVICAKNQLQKGKKMNVYRFNFIVPNSDQPSKPKDYLSLETINSEGKSFIQSILKNRQVIKKSQKQLQICYRTYQKKLVISQHDFVTAQKTIMQQELDQEQSNQGKQIYNEVVYNVCFSVRGIKDEKSIVYNRGHVNLCGMKASLRDREIKNQQNDEQVTSIKQLRFDGYINVELDTSVNSNMLKQPVAKQIRTFAQKLICLLQKSDAI